MKTTIKVLSILVTLSVILFTSCIDDPENDTPPTITINNPSADTVDVFIGDTVFFNLTLTSETSLTQLRILSSVADVEIPEHTFSFVGTTQETIEASAIITNEITDGTEIQITFTADNETKSANANVILIAKAKATPLSEAQDFEWKRIGGNDAVGLEEFGLSWTSNSAELNAVIKKDADKFVELESDAWTTITTMEALIEAIDAAEDMERWEKVSASLASKTYDISLGTIKDGKYFLIHITNSSVETGDVGTTVTVTGQFKD